MLTAIALAPSAPVLVPELAGQAAGEVADLRAATINAAAALPDEWIAVGVGPGDDVLSRLCGTFAGYGAEVQVSLSPRPCPGFAALPLCALMVGWLRGRANPEARAVVHVYPADLTPADSLTRGGELRAEIDRVVRPTGVLIVADGANTLTPAAPGGYDPDSVSTQAALDEALSIADVTALGGLPPGVIGRVAYQVLAGLAGADTWSVSGMHSCAPFGVGYTAALWERAE